LAAQVKHRIDRAPRSVPTSSSWAEGLSLFHAAAITAAFGLGSATLLLAVIESLVLARLPPWWIDLLASA
jgi:hypothetical protein